MSATYIRLPTIEEGWLEAMEKIVERGHIHTDNTSSVFFNARKYTELKRIQLDHLDIRIDMPSHLSFLTDESEKKIIRQYISLLSTRVKSRRSNRKDENYTYKDFIEKEIYSLKNMLETNSDQVCKTIYKPNSWQGIYNGCLENIECRIQAKTKLHFIAYFAYGDIWEDFITNVGALQLLKEWIAYELGIKDGTLAVIWKDACIYEYSWKKMEKYTGIKMGERYKYN